MAVLFNLVFCFFIFVEFSATSKISDCRVDLSYGSLKGKLRSSVLSGFRFCSYQGIPYAKPPIGNLRFKDPDEDPIPWQGIKYAYETGKSCVQVDPLFHRDGPDETDEDCLFINVYTPKVHEHISNNNEQLLPVMLWIHGGGFVFGSGNEDVYGPDFLVERNVLLVTFNYRLGVFGFLNLGTDDIPGNAGLKDQVTVLKWVKNNIRLFGGNPDKVTVFGESAGATSIQYHMVSNMSRGYFHQAIMQSGSIMAPWAFNKKGKAKSLLLGNILNCTDVNDYNDTTVLANCLRDVSPEILREYQHHVTSNEDRKAGMYYSFIPSPEDVNTRTEHIVVEHPAKFFESGRFQKIPSLFGYNSLEGFMFVMGQSLVPDFLSEIDKNFDLLVPENLALPSSNQFEHIKNKIRKFYFNDKPLTWDTIDDYCKLVGDFSIVIPVYRLMLTMMKHSTKPIYSYGFSVKGNRNLMSMVLTSWRSGLNLKGASHFDELGYLFNYKVFDPKPIKKPSLELTTIERMATLWTNFAKTGKMDGEGFSGWEPQQIDNEKCLLINETSTYLLSTPCLPNRTKFWKSLYGD